MSDTSIFLIQQPAGPQENLRALLTRAGYQITVYYSGTTAVHAALNAPPDLILCDANLPGTDGFAVLKMLANKPSVAIVPCIMLNGADKKADLRRAMNLGADDYLALPYSDEELLSVVALRLRKAAGRAAALSLSYPARTNDRLQDVFDREGKIQIFKHDHLVVRENELPHFVYLIETGRVHLTRSHPYGRDYIIAELGAGDVFGLSTVMEEDTFHYTARVASTRAECRLLPAERLTELVKSDQEITSNLVHMLANRMVVYGDRLVLQAYDSVRRRTALIICQLQEKTPDDHIRLKRKELAAMVGSTKESVSRALSDFRREGLISVEGRKIMVLDTAGLRVLLDNF